MISSRRGPAKQTRVIFVTIIFVVGLMYFPIWYTLDYLLPRLLELSRCDWSSCVRVTESVIEIGFIGPLGAGRFEEHAEALRHSADPVVVRVNSVGGIYEDGIRMARSLDRLAGTVATRIEVRGGQRCESMCAVLWSAVMERVAGPDACFMFHGVRKGTERTDDRYAGVAAQTNVMRRAIGRVDGTLLAELDRRGAFDPVPCDVYLSAAEIAALGGAWLRLDPGLAEAEATDGGGAGCRPARACQTAAPGR